MRPSMEKVIMDMTFLLAERSTCIRRQVACLITNPELTQILAMGYNGVERKGPETCGPNGTCLRTGNESQYGIDHLGCLHAEVQALVKAPPGDKVVFCTIWPCLTCARLMLNSNVVAFYSRGEYSTRDGVELLTSRGIECLQR